MTGWLIALGILGGLAVLPLGVQLRYDADGPLVRLIVGFVRIKVFPGKNREHKPKKDKPKKDKPEKASKTQASGQPDKTKNGGGVHDFMTMAALVLEFLGDFRRKLRLSRLELKVILAGDDPADLAVNYGRAWAGIGNLFPLLERAFVIKKRNIEVECDFTAEETTVIARLDITITLARLFSLGLRYGLRGLRILSKMMNMKKGGASE